MESDCLPLLNVKRLRKIIKQLHTGKPNLAPIKLASCHCCTSITAVNTIQQTAVGALFLYTVGITVFGFVLEYYFSLMWEFYLCVCCQTFTCVINMLLI